MAERLDKNALIISIIAHLRSWLGRKNFVIRDTSPNDRSVVGVESPFHLRVLIYIATQIEGYFYYELEIPSKPNSPFPFDVTARGSVLTFEELAELVEKHLRYYG